MPKTPDAGYENSPKWEIPANTGCPMPTPPSSFRFYPFLFALMALIAAPWSACGADGEEGPANPAAMDYDKNPLGYADAEGRLGIWYEYGNWVEFDDAMSLIVRLHFSGARGVYSPYLGRGWQFPLLESSVIPKEDGALHVLLPSGGTLRLMRDAAPGGDDNTTPPHPTFHTADKRWSGVEADDGYVLSNSIQGWNIVFGREGIREVVCGTRALEWVREGGRVTGIRLKGKTGKPDFALTFGDNGLLSGFVASEDTDEDTQPRAYHFKYAVFPETRRYDANPPKPEQTLCQADDGQPFTVAIAPGEPVALKVDFTLENKSTHACTWDPVTGYILTEDETITVGVAPPPSSYAGNPNPKKRAMRIPVTWHYSLAAPKNAGDPPVISRVNAGGEYEYTAADPANGTESRRTTRDGDLIYVWRRIAGAPAPDFNQPAEKKKLLDDGLYHTVYKMERNEKGLPVSELRVDDYGVTTLTLYNADGDADNWKVIPSEPAFAAITARKIKELLAATDGGAGGTANNSNLEILTHLYLAIGDTAKVEALFPGLSDESQFGVRESAITNDPKLTIAEKIARLRQLETVYTTDKEKREIERMLRLFMR